MSFVVAPQSQEEEIPRLVDAVPLVNGEACEVALARYKIRYAESMKDPEGFWSGKYRVLFHALSYSY